MPGESAGKQDSLRTRVVFGQLLLVVLGAAALMWPAFVNGFPLVYQDSAWYLNPFGGGGAQHPGRTIGYSIFIGVALQIPSLWSIVVAQALVTSALIVRVAAVAAGRPRDRVALPAAALLAVLSLSGAAKYVSWVMADVTTSWLFLAGTLWMLSSRPVDRISAVAIAALSVLAHNSHLPLAIVTSAGVAGVVYFFVPRGGGARRSAGILFVICLLFVPGAKSVNSVFAASSGLFRGTDSFLMYRLIDSGIIIPTLDRYCGKRAWKSCKYKEEFARHIGQSDGWFLFHASSPFFTELGGWTGEEQGEIVAGAFRCCWDQIAVTTAIETWQQFWSVDSSDGLAQIDTNPTFGFLKHNLRSDLLGLDMSRQRRGEVVKNTLHPVPETLLHALMILLAVALAAKGLINDRPRVALLLASVMFFLLANSLVCAFGSSINARYQGRVAWLLPFALVVAVAWLREKTDA